MQTKNKHTQGPWTSYIENNSLSMNEIGIGVVMGTKGIVCTTEESSIQETEANSRLIAAAPDMLEALERINAKYAHLKESDSAEWLLVQNAIEKAKGE